MATLYSFTSTADFSNFNWNTNTDNYAWTFQPSTAGYPNSLVLRLQGVTGTPQGIFYIRNQNTASGATTYATSGTVTLSAGSNTISFTNSGKINTGTTYYVWFARTSDSSNYPAIYLKSIAPTYTIYRSTAANADPTTSWKAGDISMDITGPTTLPNNLMLLNVG